MKELFYSLKPSGKATSLIDEDKRLDSLATTASTGNQAKTDRAESFSKWAWIVVLLALLTVAKPVADQLVFGSGNVNAGTISGNAKVIGTVQKMDVYEPKSSNKEGSK